MAWLVGSQPAVTGYPEIKLAASLNGAASGAYKLGCGAAIDYDGGVNVPLAHTGGLVATSVGAAGANAGGTGGLPVGNLKGTQGRLAKAQVTAAGNGSVALLVYDNAVGDNSGVVIGVIKGAAAVGDQYAFDMPAKLGISIPAQANAPTVTLGWS